MHAVSLTLWGAPRGRAGWLREGLAAAAEDRCGPATGRGTAAQLLVEGRLAPATDVVADFGGLARADDLAAYLEAGAFVQYLLAHYGRAPLERVWRGGEAEVPRAYGRSLPVLGAGWRGWLAATAASERPASYADLRTRGCG